MVTASECNQKDHQVASNPHAGGLHSSSPLQGPGSKFLETTDYSKLFSRRNIPELTLTFQMQPMETKKFCKRYLNSGKDRNSYKEIFGTLPQFRGTVLPGPLITPPAEAQAPREGVAVPMGTRGPYLRRANQNPDPLPSVTSVGWLFKR